jgi:hypothetical protein
MPRENVRDEMSEGREKVLESSVGISCVPIDGGVVIPWSLPCAGAGEVGVIWTNDSARNEDERGFTDVKLVRYMVDIGRYY